MPTDLEIEKVKKNLENLQSFNDYLYVHGNPYIAHCYLLLSETQTDKGLKVCVDMMESAFKTMAGTVFGPVGSVGATVLCGVLEQWDSAPPPDMDGAFADLISRFEAASVDVDNQLAVYHDDPVSYWDTQLSYDGNTCTVGDLATIDFPTEGDEEFFTLMNPCLWSLDQFIWKFVLLDANFQINEWLPSTDMSTSFDFVSWQDSFYGAHPSYWATCEWHQDTGDCGDESCYYLTQYNLATGHGMFSDGHISDDACNYLFADRAPGHPYKECTKGLFPRDEVFTQWGMKVVQIWLSNAEAPTTHEARKNWATYMRAKKDGKAVLSDLEAEIGMDGIKQRLLDAVRKDPTLRADLTRAPHATMEKILGVAVPRFVKFSFVAEGPRNHALVLPWDSEL